MYMYEGIERVSENMQALVLDNRTSSFWNTKKLLSLFENSMVYGIRHFIDFMLF